MPYRQKSPEGFKESETIEFLIKFDEQLEYNLPPGKPLIPFRYVINFNKGTMGLYLYSLMCYFDNFSTGAWIYLALHGSYGMFWTIKDCAFPDPAFMRKATLSSIAFALAVAIIPYYMIGYWMMSK